MKIGLISACVFAGMLLACGSEDEGTTTPPTDTVSDVVDVVPDPSTEPEVTDSPKRVDPKPTTPTVDAGSDAGSQDSGGGEVDSGTVPEEPPTTTDEDAGTPTSDPDGGECPTVSVQTV
jgi:hypothetical protein